MKKQPKSIKTKVFFGYLFLIGVAVSSVWFVYSEIVKIAVPKEEIQKDNQKLVRLGNLVTTLYAAESAARNSILTGSSKDYDAYKILQDSASVEIDFLKSESDESQLLKLDSVQQLMALKESSINEIILFRNYHSKKNTLDRAIGRIYKVKDSIFKSSKPIVTNNSEIRKFFEDVIPQDQLDSLRRLPVSGEMLTAAFDKMLTDIVIQDNAMKYELYVKEQKMIDENRQITDQLRVVLSSLEQEILNKSYLTIEASKQAIDGTIKKISWVGGGSLLLLFILASFIVRDINNNQSYRNELERLNAEKADLLRSKTMLMATVTHDLQTPLGSIVGFSDLISKTTLNEKQQQYVANIKHSTDYILKLVNDLLDFTKLENNKLTIEKVAFNFKKLIESTAYPLVPNAKQKNIELCVNVTDELNALFISDPHRIKQVLTNLISNAVKFTQEGSVEVDAKVEGAFVVIEVLDTGIGIADAEQTAVFKEFTQAHQEIEKKYGGTGLGLTISKRILGLLGGSITLQSEEGKGSVFTVKIPKVVADKQVTDDVATPIAFDTVHFLEGKHFLITDDDALQLSLMKEIFAQYPVQITTTTDASTVVELLERETFDLVFTDIQMPKIDGFELVKQIRNHPNLTLRNIPVIALSGKRNLTEEDFLKAGFTTSHPKPIVLEELLDLLQYILKQTHVSENKKIATSKSDGALFNLDSLRKFTQNDETALASIVDIFIKSAQENILALQEATQKGDLDAASDIAHKMIPMLKQMEVFSIAEKLEPIEDMELQFDSSNQWDTYIRDIQNSLDALYLALRASFKP